jgi:NAD dependent epimerase/dehydratase family enzyme
VAIRSAMMFSPDRGGVFDAFLGLVRHGFGGRHGRGDQYVSWIHEADFTRAIDFLMEQEELAGVVNVASPNPLPNRELMRALCDAWGARIAIPIPAWALAIGALLRRTETELLLKSRRVVPGRLLRAGFQFRYPDWPEAARELVRRWRDECAGMGEGVGMVRG